MNQFRIILVDGTEYVLADASFGSKFTIICADKAEFESVWDKMTRENMARVTITSDGSAVTTINNLIPDGVQAVYNQGGTVTGHFYFHGGSFVPAEAEYIEAARILLGEG
jgi:hypothetical protein